ncbi:PEP-CTERM sorting domain-containing protein [Accumulibacter sp.]|uniref:PEP-CTERM sorting domain-containing protein n=1 Tax=Accumulibacter sp. TaxID=2053492 RepID=UPI0025F9AA76|nr:PEP-CTERM sorting domain-containing protein [Accumulibacter sp.]MCM8596932.1 PEP-CTERM sorting domain-containing protein [Accumulibacter sp.]MCM8626806.1 PEP-CTERM sorting domain-containing protein [Accumulibacter sp.]MDS4051081.1 PEP-CTERM sorting domain-containing protein [Accumulibacter sp.]
MKNVKATLSLIARAFCAGAMLLPASSSLAAPIAPTSYDMPNGDGQASGGTYNYWDRNYTGAGSTTTDGAALSGGLGKLTDGVVSTSLWYNVSNAQGTGEYVGWYRPVTLNPVITFHFAGNPSIDSITIQLDNSNVGGVIAPSAIRVDGISESFTPPALGTVGSVTLGGLSLVGPTHTIELDQVPGYWVFVSEISFDGTATQAPEPASLALLGLALTAIPLARRRRN